MRHSNKDAFYKILVEFKKFSNQDLGEDSFREMLDRAIEDGEINDLDFKESWIRYDKLSKLILSIANYGGGNIIFGVSEKDNKFNPVGLDEFKNKADIIKGIENYIPTNLINLIQIQDLEYDKDLYSELQDMKFQVMSISSEDKYLPYLSIKEDDKIHKSRVYTRRGTNIVEADNHEIEEILERKVNSIFSNRKTLDLESHLSQLKELYNHISKTKTNYVNGALHEAFKPLRKSMSRVTGYSEKVDNENYPELSFEQFINECIADKQNRIRDELDI